MSSTGQKQHTFIARGANYTITIDKPTVRYNDQGRRVENGGLIADFSPNGVFTTDDAEVADKLREKAACGVDFWDNDNAPDAVQPTELEVLTEAVAAAGAHDTAKLNELLESEKATHNRALVVGTLQQQLTDVRKQVQAGVKSSPKAAAPVEPTAAPKSVEVANEAKVAAHPTVASVEAEAKGDTEKKSSDDTENKA